LAYIQPMSNLEKSRDRLKAAFARLENAIEKKISALEVANLNLSEEITSLKEELQTTINPPQANELETAKKELSLQFDSGLISKQASQQIDLSLSELKKLVK
jgi:hypothetical protein